MKTRLSLSVFLLCFVLFVSAQTNLLSGWDANQAADKTPSDAGWMASDASLTWAVPHTGDIDGTNSTASYRKDALNSGYFAFYAPGARNSAIITYAYPVTLESGKLYRFTGKNWRRNGQSSNDAGNVTFAISSSTNIAGVIAGQTKLCNAAAYFDYDFSFGVETSGTYYLLRYAENTTSAMQDASADLSLVETVKLGCSVSAVNFAFDKMSETLTVYSNGSSDAITINAPVEVSVEPALLPSTGGTVTVSAVNKTDFSGNIVISQGTDQITIPVSGSFIPISTITEKGAWCWFADPRALHYKNDALGIDASYIGYIDVHGAVKAMQIDHKTNTKNEVLVRSWFQPDDHNNPTFIALPDGRIMIFYARHTDEACFYYRVSQKAGDITTFGKEVRLETDHKTTYPSPFILSDDPNHIYLCWRGIGWHPTIGRMPVPTAANNDEVTFNWGPYQILRSLDQASGVRPYAKYTTNGKDKIYLTYTTTHPDNQTNNWLYFNMIDINTKKLTDIKGKVLQTVGSGTLYDVYATDAYYNANTDAVVDKTTLRDWVWETSMDADGNPHIAMVRINSDKTSHDYYYAKWTGSEWKKTFLENGGGWFHASTTEKCYSGGMAINGADPNIIYCSVPVEGEHGKIYEIKKYVMDSDWNVSSISQVTVNSEKNNVRPYVINNSDNKLVWMYGDYYYWFVYKNYPLGYPTGIRAGFELPQADIDLNNGLVKNETFDNVDGFTGNAQAANGILSVSQSDKATIALAAQSAFSITLSPYIDNNSYYGDILSFGDVTYGLAQSDIKPYVKIGTETYASTNKLANSDSWITHSQTTDGSWQTPAKYGFFSLTITYENGVLRTFINGLLDQSVDAVGLSLSDITIGGFNGSVNDCRVYSRALSQDEIKALSDELSDMVADIEFNLEYNSLTVPAEIYTDIVLQSAFSSGETITWTSSNTNLVTNTGLVNLPESETEIELTATVNKSGVEPKVFSVKVMPRNIQKNKILHYQFETSDLFTDNGINYVTDKSGNNNHVRIYGNATVDGTLNLTANTTAGFSTNGYAMAADGILGEVRSYTFVVKINPTNLDAMPRVYDFGSASSNSVFLRLNAFGAGLKYNGGATTLISPTNTIPTGHESELAVTFDAGTATTKIYLNGVEVSSATTITNEPCQLSQAGANNRNYIGRTQWWDVNIENADYCGTIDDFYLFDIDLTKDEIEDLEQQSTNCRIPIKQKLTIYPNPVSKDQSVFINCDAESDKMLIEVLNVQGQKIQSIQTNTFPVEIKNNFANGLYLVKMSDGKNNVCQGKLIVQ